MVSALATPGWVHRWVQDLPVAELEDDWVTVISMAMLRCSWKVAEQHPKWQRSPSALYRRRWSVSA